MPLGVLLEFGLSIDSTELNIGSNYCPKSLLENSKPLLFDLRFPKQLLGIVLILLGLFFRYQPNYSNLFGIIGLEVDNFGIGISIG